VARELFGRTIPVVVADARDVRDGVDITVRASEGSVDVGS